MELILWIVFCGLVDIWAQNRGRSFWFGFLWSLVLSPIVGGFERSIIREGIVIREE